MSHHSITPDELNKCANNILNLPQEELDKLIQGHTENTKSVDFGRVIVLVKGCSGAGKSTFADYLRYIHTFGNSNSTVVICEADNEMYENGEYVFKPEKLGMAHTKCREKFEKALEDNTNLVILSNTSTTDREIRPYLFLASKFNYTVFTVVLENRAGTQNQHNVPQETLDRQAKNIRESLKLI